MSKPNSIRWRLAGLSLSMLMPSLATSIANVALPALAHGFSAPFQAVQWVVLAYLLGITTLIVSAGRIADMIGRRRLLLAGIWLFTAASLLCGLAPTLWLLIAARAVQGLGAAIMMALTVAMVGETVSRQHRGSAMGLLGTMSALGTTLGPSLGGMLIAASGWRSVFLVNVPLGILNVLLAHRLPADRPRQAAGGEGFDAIGTLLLGATLGAFALAMTIGRGSCGAANWALLLAAVLGLALFGRTEMTSASPLIRLSMFRRPGLGASLAMSTVVSTVMMATLVVGPFYLSGTLALDAAVVGFAMSAGPLVAALTGVPGGRMVDRFGGPRMTVAGLVVMASGCVILAMMPASAGLAGYVAPSVVLTAGYALFQAANNTLVMTDIPQDQRGLTAGLLNLSRNLGLIAGASVMGAVFAHGGMRITFSVAAMLIVAALGIAAGSRARERGFKERDGMRLASSN